MERKENTVRGLVENGQERGQPTLGKVGVISIWAGRMMRKLQADGTLYSSSIPRLSKSSESSTWRIPTRSIFCQSWRLSGHCCMITSTGMMLLRKP